MSSISAAAVGAVALVTTRLGAEPPETAAVGGAAMQPAAAPPAAAQSFILIPRTQWGALEPQISTSGLGENARYDNVFNPNGWLEYPQPLEEVLSSVVIHHSALPLTDGPREIQRLHTEEKGFADVGYHYIIDETGQIYEGRPLNVRGAHTYGHNYASVGICLMGNFEEISVPEIQFAALKSLLADLRARFPLISSMAGHKDLNPGQTLCPGVNLHTLLPNLIKEIF